MNSFQIRSTGELDPFLTPLLSYDPKREDIEFERWGSSSVPVIKSVSTHIVFVIIRAIQNFFFYRREKIALQLFDFIQINQAFAIGKSAQIHAIGVSILSQISKSKFKTQLESKLDNIVSVVLRLEQSKRDLFEQEKIKIQSEIDAREASEGKVHARIIAEATASKERIVEEANKQAQAITAQVAQECDAIKREADQLRQSTIEEFVQSQTGKLERRLDDETTQLEALSLKLKQARVKSKEDRLVVFIKSKDGTEIMAKFWLLQRHFVFFASNNSLAENGFKFQDGNTFQFEYSDDTLQNFFLMVELYDQKKENALQELKLTPSVLKEFYLLTLYLGNEDLLKLIKSKIIKEINQDPKSVFALLAELPYDKDFSRVLINSPDLLEDPLFLELKPEYILDIVKDINKIIEADLLRIVIKWAEQEAARKGAPLQNILEQPIKGELLLDHIRFEYLLPKQFEAFKDKLPKKVVDYWMGTPERTQRGMRNSQVYVEYFDTNKCNFLIRDSTVLARTTMKLKHPKPSDGIEQFELKITATMNELSLTLKQPLNHINISLGNALTYDSRQAKKEKNFAKVVQEQQTDKTVLTFYFTKEQLEQSQIHGHIEFRGHIVL